MTFIRSLNEKLSEEGAAMNYSHEVNGHVLIYMRTHNRELSKHKSVNMIETNQLLIDLIFESIRETFNNIRSR